MYTDIAVPSLHRQDGRQYDGEIILTHVYSQDKDDKRVRIHMLVDVDLVHHISQLLRIPYLRVYY